MPSGVSECQCLNFNYRMCDCESGASEREAVLSTRFRRPQTQIESKYLARPAADMWTLYLHNYMHMRVDVGVGRQPNEYSCAQLDYC